MSCLLTQGFPNKVTHIKCAEAIFPWTTPPSPWNGKATLFQTEADLWPHVDPQRVLPDTVWGIKPYSCVNTTQHRAMRTFLGVGKCTPLPALYGDVAWVTPYTRHRTAAVWGVKRTFIPWFTDIGNYLPISENDLPISVNKFPISVNDLPISVNHLPISVNHLPISVNGLSIYGYR